MRAVCNAGIHWSVVRVWPDADRAMERKMKNRHNSKLLCPICNPDGWKHRGTFNPPLSVD